MNNNLPLEIEWNIIKFMEHPVANLFIDERDKYIDDTDSKCEFMYLFFERYNDIKKAKRLTQRINIGRDRDLLKRLLSTENYTVADELACRRQLALSMSKYTIT